jgi:tetratricopeptide (TPR) repeat protein
MKKNLGFGEAIELYLRKVVGRSPLPRLQKLCFKHCGQAWPVIGISLIIIVFGVSLKYSKDSVVGARNIKDVVEVAARRGDYATARFLWDDSMSDLEDMVYPERKITKRIEELTQNLEMYPESREIYQTIAELYKQIGNEEKVQEYRERARILDPNEL